MGSYSPGEGEAITSIKGNWATVTERMWRTQNKSMETFRIDLLLISRAEDSILWHCPSKESYTHGGPALTENAVTVNT